MPKVKVKDIQAAVDEIAKWTQAVKEALDELSETNSNLTINDTKKNKTVATGVGVGRNC